MVIDPAVYYGDREVELAMPLLFGGFPPGFLEAYDEAWQLDTELAQACRTVQALSLAESFELVGAGYLDSCLEYC